MSGVHVYPCVVCVYICMYVQASMCVSMSGVCESYYVCVCLVF